MVINTHFDPEVVSTTAPPTASVLRGDDVIDSPSSNDGDPEIKPVTEKSRFFLQP